MTSIPAPGTADDREIVSTRLFSFPPERLFEAFADPSQLTQWWGPNGFTNTFEHFDFRPAGEWRFTMHGPDGAQYHNTKTFVEVVRPERIAFDHSGPMHRFRMTHTFAEAAEGTQLTWRMQFESADEVAKLGDFIRAANEENFDRLAAFLTSNG